jgi:hypothetical protein
MDLMQHRVLYGESNQVWNGNGVWQVLGCEETRGYGSIPGGMLG